MIDGITTVPVEYGLLVEMVVELLDELLDGRSLLPVERGILVVDDVVAVEFLVTQLDVYVTVWGGFGVQVGFASVTVDVMVLVSPLTILMLMLTTITVMKMLFS